MSDQALTHSAEGLRDIWYRVFLVLNELLSHTLVLALVVISVEALHRLMFWLHHDQDIVFFGHTPFEFPATWLFDAADAVMIAALLFRGIISAYLTYRGAKR
jgi:hypothetical protein